MIRSQNMSQHFVHGFVHDCQYSNPEDIFRHLQQVFSLDSEWKYATSSQFHSDIVLTTNRHFPKADSHPKTHKFGGCVGDGDAIISSQRKVLLCTRTADCVPILLYNSSQVGVVHAGWRGIAKEIAIKCCSMMKSVDGAIIGPCISQQNYEVGLDVIEAFEKVDLSRDDVSQGYVNQNQEHKFLLDVTGSVIIQLQRAGLKKDQIEVVEECTFLSKEFHSYRRDGKKAGRNWSCIGLL